MKETTNEACVVLLSGGQDSTTCLFWALQKYQKVICLSVQYGQKHSVEVSAARNVIAVAQDHYPDAQIVHEELEVGRILAGTSPLVNPDEDLGKYETVSDLPGGVEPTFVPARNLLFLTLAANRAAVGGAKALVTGLCEEDFGGYFDCRQVFVDAMEKALSQGLDGEDATFSIHTPLMNLDKAASVRLAQDFKGCWEALSFSHTCYDGKVPPCGKCHACHLRVRGFAEAGVADPLIERLGTDRASA